MGTGFSCVRSGEVQVGRAPRSPAAGPPRCPRPPRAPAARGSGLVAWRRGARRCRRPEVVVTVAAVLTCGGTLYRRVLSLSAV